MPRDSASPQRPPNLKSVPKKKDEGEIPGVICRIGVSSAEATRSYLVLVSLPAQFGEQIRRVHGLGQNLELVALRSCLLKKVGRCRLSGEQ